MPLPVESASNKVIIVTGANRGIGLAAAKELSARGAKVVAGARDPSSMPPVEGADTLPLDTADPESCRRFVEAALERFGRIDGLINNAGILIDRDQSILSLAEDDLRRVMEVNLIGPLRLCQLVIPHMLRQNYGRVVNVSSGLGSLTDMGGGYPSYRLTKLALNGMTRILAAELDATSNVKVNSISPGWVRTDMGGSGASRDPTEAAREIADLVSIGKSGPSGGFFYGGEPTEW
jgi:NAD(P)-dependent dehydrogenase (short-subunit alcohol dehydrogenase family)